MSLYTLQTTYWRFFQLKNKKTLVIDADWLAFMAACVTHVTWYSLIDADGQSIKNSKTKTVVTKLLNKKLKENPEFKGDIVSEKILDPNWKDTAKNVMLGKANKLKRIAGCTDVMVVIVRTN